MLRAAVRGSIGYRAAAAARCLAARCLSSSGTDDPHGEEEETALRSLEGRSVKYQFSRVAKHWQLISRRAAKQQYLLHDDDLDGLTAIPKPNPYRDNAEPIYMLRVVDVERACVSRWGSVQAFRAEQRRREEALASHRGQVELEVSSFVRHWRRHRRAAASGSDAAGPGSKAVHAAILSNTVVMLGKAGGAAATGSAALAAEAVHSAVDALNQALLAVGIHMSRQPASAEHPYGHARERYVWSLISGVGVFFLGCGVSVYHGISTLLDPQPLSSFPVGMAVLAGSLLVEGYTCAVALAEVRKQAAKLEMPLLRYIRRGPDPMNVAVLMEDAAACVGVGIAASCLAMSHWTGNAMWDSLGSITIGGLLGGVAVFLIQKNREALIGTSLPPERIQRVMDALYEDEVVSSIHDVKAVVMGATSSRFKAEIFFNPEAITRRALARNGSSEQTVARLRDLETDEALMNWSIHYGSAILNQVGREVDRLEQLIREELPELKHVDLEVM